MNVFNSPGYDLDKKGSISPRPINMATTQDIDLYIKKQAEHCYKSVSCIHFDNGVEVGFFLRNSNTDIAPIDIALYTQKSPMLNFSLEATLIAENKNAGNAIARHVEFWGRQMELKTFQNYVNNASVFLKITYSALPDNSAYLAEQMLRFVEINALIAKYFSEKIITVPNFPQAFKEIQNKYRE
jgi:hypothetical protein